MRGVQKFLLLGVLLQNVSGAPKRNIPDPFVIKLLKGDQKSVKETTRNRNSGYTLDATKIATNDPKVASSKSYFRNTPHGFTTDELSSDSLIYQNYRNNAEFKEPNFPFIKVSKSNSRFNTERGSEKLDNPLLKPPFQPDKSHRSYEKETSIININSKENKPYASEMSEVSYAEKLTNNNLKENEKHSSINVFTSKPLDESEEISNEGAGESQFPNNKQTPYFSNEFTLNKTLSGTNDVDNIDPNDTSLLEGRKPLLKKKNEESAAHDLGRLDQTESIAIFPNDKHLKTTTKETRNRISCLNEIEILSLSETVPHLVRTLSLPQLEAPNQGQNEIKPIDHFTNLSDDNTLVGLKKVESEAVDPFMPDRSKEVQVLNKTFIKTGSYDPESSENAKNSFRGKVTTNNGTFAENKSTRKQQTFPLLRDNLSFNSHSEDEQDENSKASEQQINFAVSPSTKGLPILYELPYDNNERDGSRTFNPRKDTYKEPTNLFGTPLFNIREGIETSVHISEASNPSLGLSTLYGTPIRDQQREYSANEPQTINIFKAPQPITPLYELPSNNFKDDNSKSLSNRVPLREIYFADEALEASYKVDLSTTKTKGVNSISSEVTSQDSSPDSGQVENQYEQEFKIPIPSEDQLSLYELPDPDLSTGDSNKSEQKLKPPTKDEPHGASNQDKALLPFPSEDQGQTDDSQIQPMMGMPFDFGYSVEDPENGNMFSHNAASDGQVTEGEYRVLLPDGRLQIVQFRDEGMGFIAKIRYENPEFTEQREIGQI